MHTRTYVLCITWGCQVIFVFIGFNFFFLIRLLNFFVKCFLPFVYRFYFSIYRSNQFLDVTLVTLKQCTTLRWLCKILPIFILLTVMVHRHSYTPLTLRLRDDHPYFSPCSWIYCVGPSKIVSTTRESCSGSLRWRSINRFSILLDTGWFYLLGPYLWGSWN